MKKGKLLPEGYMPRLLDHALSERLDQAGAVEVTGTMWCGKTWTSTAFGNSITRIGLTPARLAAEADPATALIGEAPHVIDEWQDVRRPESILYRSLRWVHNVCAILRLFAPEVWGNCV